MEINYENPTTDSGSRAIGVKINERNDTSRRRVRDYNNNNGNNKFLGRPIRYVTSATIAADAVAQRFMKITIDSRSVAPEPLRKSRGLPRRRQTFMYD